MAARGKRDVWVDNVKVVACILVVLGHFFQSMVKASILNDSPLYNYFNDTIYYFHVPLFFICSGFLYQKYSRVNSFDAWKNNIIKKIVALGVPYFIFSTATWILKKVFSSTVNTQLGGISSTLFRNPTPPYWYLYVLFILFLLTVTTTNIKKQIIMLSIASVVKILSCVGAFSMFRNVYFIDKALVNWVWFVLGMTFAYDVIKMCNITSGIVLFFIFLIGSLLVQKGFIGGSIVGFILGLVACYSVICIVYSLFKDGVQNKYWEFAAKYTMPIFLMHTLFAAPLRSILTKFGVVNPTIHISLGLAISFLGPIVVMIVLEKLKPLDFIVYPTRYIKIGKRGV